MKKYLLILLTVCFPIHLFSGIQNIDSLLRVAADVNIETSQRLNSYKQLSNHFIRSKNYDSCRLVSHKGIELSNQMGGSDHLSKFQTNIGSTYYYVGETDKAMEWYIKAYESAVKYGSNWLIAEKLSHLGIIFGSVGETETALEYYNSSLEYYEKVDDPRANIDLEIAYLHLNMGSLFQRQKDYEKALEYYILCLPPIEASGNNRALLDLYNNIASVYFHQQLYDLSLENYLKALEYASSDPPSTNYAILLANVAENYIYINQFEKAKPYLEQSLNIAKEYDLLRVEKNVYSIYSDFYYDKNDFKNAYTYRAKYEAVKDSLFNRQKSKDIANIRIKYETEKKEQENQALSIENERQARINKLLLIILVIIVISIAIILYVWSRVNLANKKLKQKQDELKKLNEQLKMSNSETEAALEFKSQFLANMSHEIRTPLNIIIGFAGILRKNIMESKLIKYIDSIELSSENLLKLLNDILDMSKIEARKMLLKPEVVDLKKLVEEIRTLFLIKAEEKNIDLSISFDENLPTVMILDEIRTRQVLVNLVGNAIKFTNEGFVKVKVYGPNKNIPEDYSPSKTDFFIDIEDSGHGIPPEHQKIIFESFRQIHVKNQAKISGTGLGLPISRRLMELMGGSLNLKSEPDKGSVFTLHFKDIPVTSIKSNEKTLAHTTLELPEIQFKSCRILIADDEAMNRSLIISSFAGTEVIVFQAENGKDAVEMAIKTMPAVILMDFNMPVIDGFEAARTLKQNPITKEIPILAFSASSLFVDLSNEEKELFSGFISKPVFISDLFEELSPFLPHTRNKTMEGELLKSKEFENVIRSDRELMNEEVIAELDATFTSRFNEIKHVNSMNLTLQFAEELKAFALKRDFKSIEVYSKKVEEACKSFNIDLVRQLLDKFPKILSQLKK